MYVYIYILIQTYISLIYVCKYASVAFTHVIQHVYYRMNTLKYLMTKQLFSSTLSLTSMIQ